MAVLGCHALALVVNHRMRCSFGSLTFLPENVLALMFSIAHAIILTMVGKNLGNYLINIIFFRFSIFTQLNLFPLLLDWSEASNHYLSLPIIFSLASYLSPVLI